MIKHTYPYKVAEIFSNDNVVLYEIPKYQREYKWGKKQLEQLFNDVIESDMGYFLGSVIGVDISSTIIGTNKMEIIDGQQRITSLSILLMTLYNRLSNYKEFFDEEQIAKLFNLKREIIVSKDANSKKVEIPRVLLQVQNNNRDDYYSLLGQLGLLISYDDKVKFAGNRRIYNAYYCFETMIDEYIQDKIDESGIREKRYSEEKRKELEKNINIDNLFKLVEKFNSVIIVLIEVETHKDAYMLFESINNRGTPLSAVDLIKNLLISTSDSDGKTDETYDKWKKVISNLGDEYAVQERFFRHYYNAFIDELNKPFRNSNGQGRQKYELAYVATRTNILEIYEKLIRKDYKKLVNDLLVKSQNYSIIINNASDDNTIKELETPLLNLERISGVPSYILLLFILSKKEELEIDNHIISKIVDDLIIFFVRRNITDYPATRNVTSIFMEIVQKVKKLKGNEVYDKIHQILKEKSSDDEMFKNELMGNIYQNNPDATRFLLCYYEQKYDTREIHTDLWERDSSNKYIWTIEHVFPEGDNIPKEWIDMIADGNKELAEQYLNEYTHKLGNLTLTGYNSNLSNMSFEKKKDRKDKKGNNIGYRNGLKINDDIVDKDSWKKEDIVTRTNRLVNVFINDFRYE